MLLHRLLHLSLIVSALSSGTAYAEATGPGAARLDYGYFCAVETIDQVEANDTISGVVNMVASAPPFLATSTVIPGKIGIGFGVHMDVLPEFIGPAVVETIHPPMGPEGIVRETWTTTYDVTRTAYNGFTFEYDYEVLLGDWTISASSDGREIYRVDFTIVDPGLMPSVPCGGPLLG